MSTLVHNVVAKTEKERARVSKIICTLMEEIVAHGYTLHDVTGQPTTWGRWNPSQLNGVQDWSVVALLRCSKSLLSP